MAEEKDANLEMKLESSDNDEETSQLYCHFCGECSSSLSELKDHIGAEHEDAEESNTNREVVEGKVEEIEMEQENSGEVVFQFYCQFCGESLNSFTELEDHIDTEHENSNEKNEISLNDDANTMNDRGSEIDKMKSENGEFKTNKRKDSGNIIRLTEVVQSKGNKTKSNEGAKTVVHKCQFCAATFVNREDFENHVEEGHDTFGGKIFTPVDRTVKLSHNIIKTGKKEYMCPFCNIMFTKHFEVLRHILNTHKNKMKDSDAKGIAYMFSRCDYCEKNFTCESELAIHRNRHTKEFVYKCPFCSLETFAEKDAFQHMKRMHKEKAEALSKKSIVKIPNPNPVGGAEILKENNLDKDTPEKDDIELSPAVTDKLTDASNIKVIKLCNELEEESDESVSPKDKSDKSFKCPYCSFVTWNRQFVNNHVKVSHKTTFKTERLRQTDVTNETVRKTGEIDFNNIASYYECQFCSYESTLKANIVKHLNSNVHVEERKKGDYENLDISKLKVMNKEATCTDGGKKKKEKGELAKVHISGIKVHVRGRQKERTSATEPIEEVNVDDKVNKDNRAEIENNSLSFDEEQTPENVRKSFELPKNQPFIKLEKMKLPVTLPKSDSKKTEKSNTKKKSENTIINSEDKVCPYCKFQSKRASALKFHINFNHQKEKDKADLNKTSEIEVKSEVDEFESETESGRISTPKKHQTVRQFSLRSSSKKSSGPVNILSGNSAGKTETPSKTPIQKVISKKRKLEDVKTNTKKLKTDITVATKKKQSGKDNEVKQTMVINVDGTVVVQDDVESTEVKQEPVVELSLSEYTEIDNDENNISEMETTGNKGNKRTGEVESSYQLDSKKEDNKMDDEVILFVCPYCNQRFKWMKSVKRHVTSSHPKEKFSKEDIEVVIEEYKGSGYRPDEMTCKLEDGFYRCPFCPKFSQWVKTIRKHIETAHKDKEFNEDHIIIVEETEESTESDVKSKAVFAFGCLFCKDRFESKASAQKHMRNSHEGKGLTAGNILILDKSSLQEKDSKSEEIKTRNKKRNNTKEDVEKENDVEMSQFGCPNCELTFNDLKGALEHIHSKHSGESTPSNSDSPAKSVDAVSGSVRVLSKKSESTFVSAENATEEVFKCPYCEGYFKFKEDIKEHLSEYHGCKAEDEQQIIVVLKSANADMNAIKPEVDHERFQCPVCPLQLRWKHSILKHARKYHPDSRTTADKIKPVADKTLVERYFCPYCSLSFKWKNSIPRHVGRIHQDKVHEFKMNDVQTSMVSPPDDIGDEDEVNEESGSYELDEMMNRVDQQGGIQMCSCTKCFKTFGTFAALLKHNIVEHNEKGKPYQCEKCPKTFQYGYQWVEHAKVHKGIKKEVVFVCDVKGCSKSYKEKKTLLSHLKKDHGEADPAARLGVRRERQVYCCRECNIELNSRALYWRHNREVHNRNAEKLHECKVCSKSFLRPHDLKDHMFVHMSTSDLQCPIQKCLFKTKKLKYLAEHINRQHHIKIDSKTLGRHVLSEKQMSAEELNLFPTTISKDQPLTNGDNDEPVNSLVEETSVEPDKQIQMLGATVDTQNDEKSDKIKPKIGLKSIITDAVKSLDRSSIDKGEELPAGKRYNCQLCPAVFPNHRQLIKHKVAEHIEELEVYRCEQCRKTFFTVYDLKEHNLLVHPTSKDFPCHQCGKSFAASSHLQKHMKRHQEVVQEVEPENSQVVCDICGIALRYRASLQQHMVRTHPEQISCSCMICTGQALTKDPVESQNMKYYCSLCEKYFCTKIVYQCHMKGIHGTTARYTCEFCPAVFSTQYQMKTHKHQVHSAAALSEHVGVTDGELASTTNDTHQVIEISNEESLGPKFLPKLSEAGLKAVAKELKVYVDEPSAGNKHWKCLLCGSCFSKVKYFNMHVRRLHVRAEHQPYRCKLCGSGFARVAEFRKHTRTHSGFRPLTCNICHKSFKQQCHLKEHLLTHGTTRQYKCEICQSSFKQRGALLAHVVRHDKLKPFKCHFCGVGFTIRWSLSKHMKKYLDADVPDTHLCHICHKTFQFFPLLLKHIQSHQEPNPWTCEVCNKGFAAYSSFYDHKSKQKHFLDTDYETVSKRKPRSKVAETVNAVGSLMNQGETAIVSGPAELEEGEMFIDTAMEQGGEQPAVEIVIQDQGNGEHTTYKVEGHRDIDILSIAKQLTEMSGSLGQDIYIEEVSQPSKADRNEEEEKIMMTMLDADEEVKSNLEKSLIQSQKMEAEEEEVEGGFERRYIQLVQTIGGNDTTVGRSYVVVQGNENVESEYEVVETESQEATEVLTEISGNDSGVEGKSYIVLQGNESAEPEYGDIVTDSRDQVAAEVLTKFSRNDSEVEGGSSIIVVQGNDAMVSDYETQLSEPLEQVAAEAVTEVGGQDSYNQTELEVTDNIEPVSKEIETDHQDQVADELLTESRDQSDTDGLVEVMQDGSTVISKKADLVEEKFVASSLIILEEPAKTASENDNEMDDGSVVNSMSIEIDNDGAAPDETQTVETTEERFANDQDTKDMEVNTSIDAGEHEMRVIVTSSEFGDNTAVTSGVEDVISESQTDQVEYVVINTDSVEIQTDQAEETSVNTGKVESDIYEPPVLKTDPIGHIQIQNIEQEDGDGKVEIESVGQDQIHTNEASHTLSLIPVNIPEYGSQPMYMFKKADGSLVYISVPEDAEFDNAELINAALEADGYIEEQSNRDDSTLEAAEILKSVAGGSNTTLEQVGTEMIDEDEQVFQLHINEGMTADFRHAVRDLSDAEIESSCKVITAPDLAEGTVAYQCTICNSILKSKKNLRYHLRRHARTEDRAFECSQCHKRFVSNSELNRHMRVHTDFRPCECKICGKKFRQPGHLMAHQYTHTGEKPFSCRMCSARFTTSTLLKNHMMKHTNLRPFKCDYESCDRSYKTQRELTMHRAVHSGLVGRNKIIKTGCVIKPETSEKVKSEESGKKTRQHICYICGKTFSGKTKLDEHIAVHEDLRRFVCDVCGLAFNTKGAVNSHAFSHIDERPEICETCGGAFKNKKSLRNHQKIHAKKENGALAAETEPQFQCPSCGKKCKSRSSLYYHIGSSPDCTSQVKQEQVKQEPAVYLIAGSVPSD